MKKLLLFIFVLTGCSSQDDNTVTPAPTTQQPPQQVIANPGNAIFYLKFYPNPYYGSGVDVWINWIGGSQTGTHIGKITNIPQSIPSCGSWWGKNFSDNDTISSTYTYHAKLDGSPSRVWDGSFTLNKNDCIKIELSNE